MLRLLPLLLLVVAAESQAQDLMLTYDRAARGLSEATLTLDRDAGSVEAVGILSSDGLFVHVTDFDANGERLTAKAMLPPAGEVAIIFIGEARGGTKAWQIATGEGYTWIEEDPQIYDQTGQRVASEDELVSVRRLLDLARRVEDLGEPREVRVSHQSLVVTF